MVHPEPRGGTSIVINDTYFDLRIVGSAEVEVEIQTAEKGHKYTRNRNISTCKLRIARVIIRLEVLYWTTTLFIECHMINKT